MSSVPPFSANDAGNHGLSLAAPFTVQRGDIRRVRRGAFGANDNASAGTIDVCFCEERTPEHEFRAAGIERIDSERRPHIPGRHLAQIVIAGNAIGRVGPDLRRCRMHEALRLPWLAHKVVEPGIADRRFVVQFGMKAARFGDRERAVRRVEITVKTRGGFRVAAHRVEQPLWIVRHHPEILCARSFHEAFFLDRGIEFRPRTVGVARLDVACIRRRTRIVEIAPPAGARAQHFRIRRVAEIARQFRQREIRRGHLQRISRRAPTRRADGHVMQRQPLIETGSLADALHFAAVMAEVLFRRNGRRGQQRCIRAFDIEIAAAEGIDVRDRGRRWVAVHHARAARQMRPAIPRAAVLVRLVEQRLCDVGTELRIEPCQKLELRAIDVPAGEIRILRALRRSDRMHGAVHAEIAAVDIAEEIGFEQHVIERGVEDRTLIFAAAFDLDLAQLRIPDLMRRIAHGLDCRTAFRVEIGAGVFGAHI